MINHHIIVHHRYCWELTFTILSKPPIDSHLINVTTSLQQFLPSAITGIQQYEKCAVVSINKIQYTKSKILTASEGNKILGNQTHHVPATNHYFWDLLIPIIRSFWTVNDIQTPSSNTFALRSTKMWKFIWADLRAWTYKDYNNVAVVIILVIVVVVNRLSALLFCQSHM